MTKLQTQKILKQNIYIKIIEQYHYMKSRNCLPDLIASFPNIPKESLESIIFQEYQRKTKRTYHRLIAPHKVASYYQQYQEYALTQKECGFLLKLADTIDLSPSLLAQHILTYHLNQQQEKEDSSDSEKKFKQQVSKLLKDTSLIEDGQLAAEIQLCILVDDNYGHISTTIRNLIGKEYEDNLKEELNKLGLAFVDEAGLREKGYDKTPDVKLEVPIAVNGHAVNWIESKASFGDEERHKEYMRDQYWSYCNRFGPGLVIYWLGFIEELNVNKEQGIMILDCFPPNQITFMEPSLLMKNINL